MISTLLGQSNLWNAAVVQDANLAYKSVLEKRPLEHPVKSRSVNMVQVRKGEVCAACVATETGKLFVGFQDGEIYSFDPATGQTVRIAVVDNAARCLQAERTGKESWLLWYKLPMGRICIASLPGIARKGIFCIQHHTP